jgi:ubiquinol-cytochrome c reductase iron-sulfur subunit
MVDGQLLAVHWPFGPGTVYILKRSQETLQTLGIGDRILADPSSDESEQPESAKNPFRSLRPDFLVIAAHCTHLGCNVGHVPKGQNEWFPTGGFMCPCHGSKYDFSGRVHKNMPAPFNLAVPSYRFIDENTIQLGRE